MKKISSILVITALCFTSCIKDSKITYKYQENDELFSCDGIDMNLIKEAVYAFEDYIKDYYSMEAPNSVDKGYYFYWEISKSDRIPAVEYINQHILDIRDELKKIDGLWIINNNEAKLNMKHPIAKCISDYMEDQQLKKIYDILVETNTFKNLVFLAPFKRDPIKFRKDRALMTYLALNTFYARILMLDFSNLEELMQINKKKFLEEQEKIKEEMMKNNENQEGVLIATDSIKANN